MKAKELLTLNGQLIFSETGDVQISQNANNELAQCLFVINKGEFKRSPLSGLNLRRYLNAKVDNITQLMLKNEISEALTNDGFTKEDLRVSYNYQISDYQILTNCDRFR